MSIWIISLLIKKIILNNIEYFFLKGTTTGSMYFIFYVTEYT